MESDMLVIVGADTHADFHVGVALDQRGGLLGELTLSNDEGGYRRLLRWAHGLGELACVGAEGTGSYGVGLSRFLRSEGVRVLEVNRVSRQTAAGTASTTPQTPRPPLERSSPGRRQVNRRPPTGTWRCFVP